MEDKIKFDNKSVNHKQLIDLEQNHDQSINMVYRDSNKCQKILTLIIYKLKIV